MNFFKKSTLFALLLFVLSCSKEELPSSTEIHDVVEQRVLATECDILGSRSACSNDIKSYTYTADFNPSNVNWTVLSGAITINSGQGTSNAQLGFSSNFTGGSIRAFGSGAEACSETISISKANASCSNPSMYIDPTIPACYPSRHPHGRYNLRGAPSGANIVWSTTYATIYSSSGGYIVMAPTTSGYFTLTATVTWPNNDPCSPGGTCTEIVNGHFLPTDNCEC